MMPAINWDTITLIDIEDLEKKIMDRKRLLKAFSATTGSTLKLVKQPDSFHLKKYMNKSCIVKEDLGANCVVVFEGEENEYRMEKKLFQLTGAENVVTAKGKIKYPSSHPFAKWNGDIVDVITIDEAKQKVAYIKNSSDITTNIENIEIIKIKEEK